MVRQTCATTESVGAGAGRVMSVRKQLVTDAGLLLLQSQPRLISMVMVMNDLSAGQECGSSNTPCSKDPPLAHVP